MPINTNKINTTIIETDLTNYKESHRKFLEELVVLHNLHLDYVKYFGRATGFSLRRCHKRIIKIQKELMKESVRAYNEHRENSKRYFAAQRAELAQKKLKKGKSNDHSNTNANSV